MLPELPSSFRTSNLIRVYCQANLRRCLVLARSSYGLFFIENGLVSLMATRAIYETVAVFLEFERQFAAIVKTGTLQEIMEFAQKKALAPRSKKMIAKHGEHLKARSIQSDIQKLSFGQEGS